jgi:glutamate-1-semialdehyde 2,1-aminomutase
MRRDGCLVGGVSSSWNHYLGVGRFPIGSAAGAHVIDTDGVTRVDWLVGWGSLLLGHQPSGITNAMTAAFDTGFGMQYETDRHLDLAEIICDAVPCADAVRFCNSGSEATNYALRIARAATGRSVVAKFEGHFHGNTDYLLFGVDGFPPGVVRDDGTIEPRAGTAGLASQDLAGLIKVLPFNDLDAVTAAFEAHGDSLAALILEPVSLNIGCVFPKPGFLEGLRELCDRFGVVLIFDEVLTGFRGAWGGAQETLGVLPDLACYAKALGCGSPLDACPLTHRRCIHGRH